MPDFIAQSTVETIETLVNDLGRSTDALKAALETFSAPLGETVSPQVFVSMILDLDEQLSRTRLLLPLCTANVQVNENGRPLSLSDLILEIRQEFDALARAQIEVLVESSPEEPDF